MTPERIIAQIDAWLAEHAWRLDETNIDFALDLRQMVLELEQSSRPVLVAGAA